jgi:hypothetical protein
MKPNFDKIDDAVLALLYLKHFTEGAAEFAVTRAWKTHDWAVLDRLREKGQIGETKNKKSVVFTKTGKEQSDALFKKLFCE